MKTLQLALVCAVVSIAALFTSTALAGNGAETTQFKPPQYPSAIGGTWTCSGVRIVKTEPKAFTKDSQTCTISNLTTLPPGTYVGDPLFVVGGLNWFWQSDYDGQVATNVTLTVTDNGDGTGTVELVAYF